MCNFGLLIIHDMRKILFAGAVMIMCHAESFAADEIYSNIRTAVVSGHGEVLPEGVAVTLLKWDGMSGESVATDTVRNGQFRLEVPVNDVFTIGSISFDSSYFPHFIHRLYLTPGAEVDIEAVDRYMFTWPVSSNVPEQAEYDLYIDNNKEQCTELQKISLEYSEK